MKEYKLDDITIVVDCEHKTAPIVSNSDFYSNKTFMKILANQTQIRTLTAFRDTLLLNLIYGEGRVEI